MFHTLFMASSISKHNYVYIVQCTSITCRTMLPYVCTNIFGLKCAPSTSETTYINLRIAPGTLHTQVPATLHPIHCQAYGSRHQVTKGTRRHNSLQQKDTKFLFTTGANSTSMDSPQGQQLIRVFHGLQ